MPKENKMVEPFRREDRYIVIKRSDMEKAPPDLRRNFSGQCRKLHEAMLTNGAPARSFAVVESDWPEYGFVWLMLEHRMAGFPVPDFNAVKCSADVAAAQTQLSALRAELELQKVQAINDAEANTAIRAERDALQLLLNDRDEQLHALEQSRRSHFENAQAAERRIDDLLAEIATVRQGPCKMIIGDELP